MEAEVLTTDIWGMPAAPEDERSMPDTFSSNQFRPEVLDEPVQPDAGVPAQADGLAQPEADGLADPEAGTKTFRDLGVAEPICAALEAAGITAAFPIQALAVPIALGGQDLIGQARTGTGKTLAFGIPLLQRLGEPADGQRSAPRSLVRAGRIVGCLARVQQGALRITDDRG